MYRHSKDIASSHIAATVVTALLLLGAAIYLLFRRDVLFISIFIGSYKGIGYDYVLAHADNPLVYWCCYCLPDALWYAALLIAQQPFRKQGYINEVMFHIVSAMPFALELMQKAGIVAGTFDKLDLITYLITYLLFLITKRIMKKRCLITMAQIVCGIAFYVFALACASSQEATMTRSLKEAAKGNNSDTYEGTSKDSPVGALIDNGQDIDCAKDIALN